ncbi:MAG: galactosyltransferase Lgt5 [Pseudomonadota bacterium]
MLAEINAVWVGGPLGAIHAGCLRSFLRHGHRVTLHCYTPPEDLPDGVATYDASQLLPREDFIATDNGSLALGSDRYRYRLIDAGFGLYVDCDVYCLKPVEDRPYIFGWENFASVNGSILKYPPDSPLAVALRHATARTDFVPWWWRRRDRYRLELRKRLGVPQSVASMPWGVWGPTLLTREVRRLGLESEAAPIDLLHPLQGNMWPLLFDPDLCVADLVTSRSEMLHLCKHMFGNRPLVAGSPLAEIAGV